MEELLRMPDRVFVNMRKYYKLVDLKDGELELKSLMTDGGYLTAQIDDGEVLIFFEGRLKSLKNVYNHLNK